MRRQFGGGGFEQVADLRVGKSRGHVWPSMTGSLLTRCPVIVVMIPSVSSSAPRMTASPWARPQ
ncbi:hypothetical protein [Streptomyces sp. NPDC058374]|uniref:hypothetical protein n=1 Tax=unclassified Streptomyces TaxID=2593676 RepID=UPI0036525E75